MICYAKLKDRESFHEWLKTEGWADRNSFYSRGEDGGWYYNHWSDYFYHKQKIFTSNLKNIFSDSKCDDDDKTNTMKFYDFLDYLNSIEQKLEVYYRDEMACIIGYNKTRYIFPTEWLEFEELTDYSHLTGPELKLLGNPMTMETALISSGDISKNKVQEHIKEQEDMLAKLKDEKEKVEKCEHESLQELKLQMEQIQRELQKKQEEMKEILSKKMEEFQVMKTKLEAQLFLLDTQIYGIRCYLGEVVQFHKLVDGKTAPLKEPVFIYQKIRYIDEELGKAALLYGSYLGGNLKTSFLELLKQEKEVRDLFLPDKRCITLFKVSRTGSTKGASDEVANILQSYEVYHGTQLALLVRNGESVHIAWLDEDKIQLWNENAFFSATKKQTQAEYNEKDVPLNTSKEEIASRYFLISIIQGIADNGTIMNFPEKINILKPNPNYIIFSMAEGWLKDTRFGMFSDILDKVSELPLKEGDMVLTGTHITRDDRYDRDNQGRSRRYEKFNNDRGIGEKNRTHDAYIRGYQVIPINKVLNDIDVYVECECIRVIPKEKDGNKNSMFYRPEYEMEDTGEILFTKTMRFNFDYEYIDIYKKCGYLSKKPTNEEWISEIKREEKEKYYYQHNSPFDKDTYYESRFSTLSHSGNNSVYYKRPVRVIKLEKIPHYFLSAEKEGSRWSNSDARANLEIERSEFIPLTYLCPTWVRYAITTGNIGDWGIAGASLSYADALKYLGIMYRHLEDVYNEYSMYLDEVALGTWMTENTEWDVILAEWMAENHVRKITEYQAKKFAKYLKEHQ